MAIATYTDLQGALADWLNRADLTQRITDFITLAESTLNKVVRSNRMVGDATLNLTSGVRKVAVPADFLEPIYIQIADNEPLEQVSPAQLITLRRARLKAQGTPAFFAVIGTNFELAATPNANLSADCLYYQQIPALSTGNATNWLLTYNPDLYLYTALLHASPFLKDDARTALFNNLLAQQVAAAVKANQVSTFDIDKGPGFSLGPADGMAPAPAGGEG